ncbi:alkylhydroperoxidase/carboxymuconolactone decarboxylase family protein YurZ [Streptomyces filamentosus]
MGFSAIPGGDPGSGDWYLWAAALLVACAAGTGFAVLRQWGGFVRAVVGVCAVFGIAVWCEAGDAPVLWTVLYALTAVALAASWRKAWFRYRLGRMTPGESEALAERLRADGILLPASLRPSPAAPARLPLRTAALLALAGLVAAGAGLAGLGLVPRAALEDGGTAEKAGDCGAALGHYRDAAAAVHALTLSSAPGDARAASFSCTQVLSAGEAAGAGRHHEAASAYGDAVLGFTARFWRDGGRNADAATASRLAVLRLAHADAMAAALSTTARYRTGQVAGYRALYETYDALVREHPGSAQAGQVPARLAALYATTVSADAARNPCPAVDKLNDLITLAREKAPGAEDPGASATKDLPAVRYRCAEQLYAKEDYQKARPLLEQVTGQDPKGPYAKKAADLLVRLEIADAEKGSAGALPPPGTTGTAPAGTTLVEISNDSSEYLEILYSGPETGTARLAACSSCVTRTLPSLGLTGGCSPQAPTTTLRLRPGTYDFVVRGASGSDVRPYTAKWALKPATAYGSCFYVSKGYGYGYGYGYGSGSGAGPG